MKRTRKSTREIFDFRTAVRGEAGLQFCDGIPRKTSAGFPLQPEKKTRGKHLWFGEGQEYTFSSHECMDLETDVQNMISLCAQNIRPEVIYMDFLKDERRPLEKVQAGKTRMISACPLTYLIAVRQYFLAFSMAVMETRIHNGCCVGINVYSDDWTRLYQHLTQKGQRVFAGDFSGFDCSESPQIHRAILDIINEWYGDSDRNKRIREVLFQEVFNSKHITGSNVYWWTHSLPSGHPLTTIINSIYNNICFRICWMLLGDGTIDAFNQHVALATYGDDNVANVSIEASDFFNQNTVRLAMRGIGLEYTPETK